MKSLKIIALFLSILPFSAMAESNAKAQIISGFNNAAQCIAPVRMTKIDGREATVQPMGFDLEPGVHSMKGSVVVDTSSCKTFGRNSQRYKVEPLEADFEAGKVYYVGYDHNAPDRKDWKLVIWKVEDKDS